MPTVRLASTTKTLLKGNNTMGYLRENYRVETKKDERGEGEALLSRSCGYGCPLGIDHMDQTWFSSSVEPLSNSVVLGLGP